MLKPRILISMLCVLVFMCTLLTSCALNQMEEATLLESAGKPTPMPTIKSTPEPLPKIEDLTAEWANGVTLTWQPQPGAFQCVLEREDDTGFAEVGRAEIGSGQITDQEAGRAGTSPVYRLAVTDGENTVYSNQTSVMIPFIFGNTGGNLANGGISCEQDGLIVRMDIVDGVIGLYTVSADSKNLLVEGLASQLNISDGYLYYLSDVANRNRSGLLFRMPLDSSKEREQIYGERLVFVLTVADRIYCTLDDSGSLLSMNTDGTDVKTVAEKNCFDLGGSGQLLYYTDTSQKAFCMLNLVTNETSSFPLKDRGFAQIWNERVYYQNESDGKKLYSCALDGSEATVLLDQEVTGVNVNETGTYCINRGDGSTPYLVNAQGVQKLADIKADYIALSGDILFIYDAKGNMYILDKDGIVTKITN